MYVVAFVGVIVAVVVIVVNVVVVNVAVVGVLVVNEVGVEVLLEEAIVFDLERGWWLGIVGWGL
jgi:hypothetical protein